MREIIGADVRTLPAGAGPSRRRFRRALLTWYEAHGRDLPWRKTTDPYHILVSEVMLQQTQVDRVLPKYLEWLAKYPSLEALAAASEPRRGAARGGRSATTSGRAGCTPSRARRWRATAAELPSDDETLLSFKGIGAYTAGAIRSFAFGQRAAILDTNVARVLFRVFVGPRRSEGARDAQASVGGLRGARASQARLRLQSGPDGPRRRRLRRAKAEVRCLPDDATCVGSYQPPERVRP